ncbi:putative Phosphodiesterase/Alkaline phosphatase D [Podospora fimiseda]|uniref:Phosphodiesterase/Alkaline phosphatase D n=1 Tax=Podospora fimiseda TaxID=252190 RepID=A0AAN7BEK7_9PEZI|nr:putative Phosphodiesterase/Alkaline phosphatase D [Podospora fimiseda]
MHLAALLGLVGLSQSLSADDTHFHSNLNYHSPSCRHDSLGINIPLVSRRTLKRGAVPYTPDQLNFTHGVASGDPYHNSVILWTRIAPSTASDTSNTTVQGSVDLYNHDTEKYIQADPNPICVDWKIWPLNNNSSSALTSQGKAYTTSDIDYTIKIEATNLSPFTSYNYQFTICNSQKSSPVGKTKTAPSPDSDDISSISLAVFSCSNFPNGYFNAYGNAARKNQHDYVIHLGDYIYENSGSGERAPLPRKIIFTLHDYRTRHGQYRTDPDLQLLSASSAWFPTWDDHEIANNGYRDGFSALNNTEASFREGGRLVSVDQRKMNAVRAYFEWMPIRQVDLDDNLRIWRYFKLGKLIDLIILDTRNYDRSITSLGWNDGYIDLIKEEANRSLMGPRQEKWFYKTLVQSKERGAKWRVVGSQVVFAGNTMGGGGRDNWGGYLANRNRTLRVLGENGVRNTVFLAGDSHQNWVSDVPALGNSGYNSTTGAGSIAVEFAGTAVSSSGTAGPISSANNNARTQVNNNHVLQWQEGYYRGYFLLTAGKDKVDAQFFGSPSVATRNSWDLPLANFTVMSGENKLARPVAGGRVEAGALRGGNVVGTNLTRNTETGQWSVVGFPKMYI